MKLILKTADFSASNIGQVETPIQYVPETLAYLEAIPTTEALLTENEKRGINTFFRGLINNSLLPKMERIYIPRFGQTEGGINLVDPDQTALNLPASGGQVSYGVNGVTLGTNYFTANFAHGLDNKFMGFANKVGMSGVVDPQRSIALGYGAFIGLGRYVSNNPTLVSGILISSTDRPLVSNRTLSAGYMFTSTDDDTDVRSLVVDGEYVTDVKESSNTSTALLIGGSSTVGTENCGHPISLLLFGTKLNQTEMTTLGGLVSNLMAAI